MGFYKEKSYEILERKVKTIENKGENLVIIFLQQQKSKFI
jgi:hypothetical protein